MSHPYEALFAEFNTLGDRLKLLRGIVQNPVPLTQEDLAEFRLDSSRVIRELNKLCNETVAAILKENSDLV